MLRIEQHAAADASADAELVLSYELRQKCRFTALLSSGEEVAVVLPRGGVLHDADILRAEDGRAVRVVAAKERLLRVAAADAQALARAAYHLGNRHAALQVGSDFLQLPYDHVLADMLQRLGAQVTEVSAPFEPEAGAYGGGAHHHGHDDALRYRPVIHSFDGVRK
jgi:urease accessory protein